MLSRLLAALLALALASPALAADAVDTAKGRNLGATEMMTTPGIVGTDYSAHAPSFASGYTLLSTIPAATQGQPRRGYFIEAQCAAGVVVLFDDGIDTGLNCTAGRCTAKILTGTGDGQQGVSVDYTGYPHSGRLRILSTDANCQMAAHAW